MERARFAPSEGGERLVHLDVIRGLALFGVLAMNTHYHFRGPAERFAAGPHPFEGFWNGVADNALRLLVEGKAMMLFSLLFGVGLALQLERKEASGGPFWGFAWRRMGVLLALGLLHVALLWYGDILAFYALDGMLLFAFLRRKAKTLWVWLASLFGLQAVAILAVGAVQIWDTSGLEAQRATGLAEAASRAEALVAGYLQPGWWDVLLFRLEHYAQDGGGALIALVLAFLNLLLGLAFWRSGVLREPEAHTAPLRRAALALLPLGLVMGLFVLYARPLLEWAIETGGWAKALVAPVGLSQVFHFQVTGVAYGAILLLLWQRAAWQPLLRRFAPVGRMALTNYLTQSLVMTTLFNGYGLGLYGKVGPAAALGMCALLFAAQVAVSRWWLARFHFGPAEWLWRCLSYGERPPFRLAIPVPGRPAVRTAHP